MKEFFTEVEAQESEEAEESAVRFMHNGFECVFFEPSEGQFLMMLAMGGRSMKKESIGHFIQLFIELGDDETQQYFHDLLMTRKSGFKVKGKGGIFDIWEHLVEQWSGKDGEPELDLPKSVSATGPSSTVRSRRSTSSRSLPAGS